MVVDMRAKMSRSDRKQANFLLRSIKDYGIPDFDVHGLHVKERAYNEGNYGVMSYEVTVGDNVVSIHYYYSDCRGCCAYARLNGESLVHCKVACFFDMVSVVKAFATLVQYLN